MIEFVQAEPLAKILEENNNDLQAFLRKHNRDDSAEYQIAPAVMDTYIKSCGTMRGVEADPPPPRAGEARGGERGCVGPKNAVDRCPRVSRR